MISVIHVVVGLAIGFGIGFLIKAIRWLFKDFLKPQAHGVMEGMEDWDLIP